MKSLESLERKAKTVSSYDALSSPPQRATEILARHAISYRSAPISEAALTVAKQCILDWFGVTLPGRAEPCASILIEELRQNSQGLCTVVGSEVRLSAHDAALVNGTASHALDYDDVNERMSGHPSVAVLPAVLAIAEVKGKTGRELLEAFIAGYEVACAVGDLVSPSHYAGGYHATGSVGAIGAAVGAGLLLGLDEPGLRCAIGLAATQSAGLKAMFGSMAKPLHAGKAAANGVFSARLAHRGFDANLNALEDEQGFITTLSSEDPNRSLILPPPGEEVVNTLFKYHAACYLTHSAIDALIKLRDLHGISPNDVNRVDLHVPIGHLVVCDIADPTTDLECKFSLRHVAALALNRIDTSAISTYCDELCDEVAIATLRSLVAVHGDMPPGGRIRAVIHLGGGATVEMEHDSGIVDPDINGQGVRLVSKFRSLAIPIIGIGAADRLHQIIGSLETASSIDKLMAAARHIDQPHR